MKVLVYDKFGKIKYKIPVNESELEFVSGRVSKGKKYYYKGLGCPYSGRWVSNSYVLDSSHNNEKIVETSNVFYLGNRIEENKFKGKRGIFQVPYQWMFSDFIGTCGPKEWSIVTNSKNCEKSSMIIHDSVCHDVENDQSYFVLDYKCGRKKFLDSGDANKLRELIDFMATYGWNFTWDKTSINDISANGLISDVGDLFQSFELSHQLGNVYSIIYSLGKLNFSKYKELLDIYELDHISEKSYSNNSVAILLSNGVNCNTIFENQNNSNEKIIDLLIEGKNCGYCGTPTSPLGDSIKKKYRELWNMNKINWNKKS